MVEVGEFISDRGPILTQPTQTGSGIYSFQVGDPNNPGATRTVVAAKYASRQKPDGGYESGWQVTRVFGSGSPQAASTITQTYEGQALLSRLGGYEPDSGGRGIVEGNGYNVGQVPVTGAGPGPAAYGPDTVATQPQQQGGFQLDGGFLLLAAGIVGLLVFMR